MWGRPTSVERNERISSIEPAGVVATACRHRGPSATREAPAVIAVGIKHNDNETQQAHHKPPAIIGSP
jgi:hypothetical protein